MNMRARLKTFRTVRVSILTLTLFWKSSATRHESWEAWRTVWSTFNIHQRTHLRWLTRTKNIHRKIIFNFQNGEKRPETSEMTYAIYWKPLLTSISQLQTSWRFIGSQEELGRSKASDSQIWQHWNEGQNYEESFAGQGEKHFTMFDNLTPMNANLIHDLKDAPRIHSAWKNVRSR